MTESCIGILPRNLVNLFLFSVITVIHVLYHMNRVEKNYL